MVLACLVIPRLSDHYGRKRVALSGTFLHLTAACGILFTTNVNVALLMNFFSGFAMPGRVFVGYAWMTGHMLESDVSKATAILMACDSAGILVASLYFEFISKDWRWIYLGPILILTLSSFIYVL